MRESIESRYSRRGFLLGSTALLLGVSLGPISYATVLKEQVDIKLLANFLTNKTIKPILAIRTLEALTKINPNFPKEAIALSNLINTHKINDVEELKNHPLFDNHLKDTALKIISAFYLGYVGTPQPSSANDNVEFITYTEIETYKLTYLYTPIPSYSRWKTNYWSELPTVK